MTRKKWIVRREAMDRYFIHEDPPRDGPPPKHGPFSTYTLAAEFARDMIGSYGGNRVDDID